MTRDISSQSGRSMIEMLIVLVIMGVLSVGGVIGFNWGVNRYRAYQVVSDLQRGSVVLKQRQSRQKGSTDAHYAAQINAEIGDVHIRYQANSSALSAEENGALGECVTGRFIRATKISKDICDHMSEMDGLSAVARYTGCPILVNGDVLVDTEGEITENIECLEQNNALVIGVRPDSRGGSSVTPAGEERTCRLKGGVVIAHGDSLDCGRCQDGVMQRVGAVLGECEMCGPDTGYTIQDDPDCGVCPEHASTTVTEQRIGTTYCYCEEGYIVNSNGDSCVVGDTCTDNGDCGPGYFCSSSCETPGLMPPSTCLPISDYTGGQSGGYIWSTPMNWFTAQNFCAASGEPMASISHFNCPYTADEYVNAGWAYCCSSPGASIQSSCAEKSSGLTAMSAAGVPTTQAYWMQEFHPTSELGYYLYSWDIAEFANNPRCSWANYHHQPLYALCGTPPPSCPEHASTTVTEQRIGETACYCEAGYAVNDSGDGCIVDACTDNNDCGGNGSGYFCAYYMEGGYGSYANLSCETGATGPIGHCLRVSDYSNSDGDYIWSTKWMDWFSAENFCAGLTETNHMSSFSDLGPIPPGDVITDEIAELQGYGLTGKHVWVTNLNNSCRAHCVRMSDGAILVANRNFMGEYGGDGGCTALCAKPPSCPEHSSRTVTAQRIGETDCYCKAGYMVNGTGDACVVETNICGYSLTPLQSDCNYTFERVNAADCDYTYTSHGDGSVTATPGSSCGSGQYCNIQWTAQSWSAGSVPWVTDSSTGHLYGKCQSLGTATKTSGGDMLVSGTSCGAGQYCGLFWTAETWSGNPPNVTASSSGTIYGKCQSYGTFIPAITIGATRKSEQKTCGEGQYCQAQYSNPEGTATISNSTTGAAYGTCINR